MDPEGCVCAYQGSTLRDLQEASPELFKILLENKIIVNAYIDVCACVSICIFFPHMEFFLTLANAVTRKFLYHTAPHLLCGSVPGCFGEHRG